jgi:starch synthase (maltosyl-transferring)
VVEVYPVIEDGRWPAKATVGEAQPIRATVFREGHDLLGASAVLVRPDGSVHSTTRMTDIAPGLDRLEAWVTPDAPGDWTFRVEGWSDAVGTWVHDATVKIEAGVDVDLMRAEGALVLARAADAMPDDDAAALRAAVDALGDPSLGAAEAMARATSDAVTAALARTPLRDMLSPSADYPLQVDRERALVGAWYEIVPRSIGAYRDPVGGAMVSGTLRTAEADLDRIADLGFDVVYLTPIHPIGLTNRKGRNNTLTALEGDPGSPYGIGSPDGGHDAIHPDLGSFDDLDHFVARARELGIEVALDVALQASPDHPWVTAHPEWFTTRADGTIAFAENPPKKYQDIYPLNFDNDPEGIYAAVRDVLQVWIDHGVTLFRVDNPHTKPLDFWQRIIADVRAHHPDVVFLSEAFTRPAMMRTLGAVGFHQSYTYFTWRTTKEELQEYLLETAYETSTHMRPAFWPTTHDILTPYMQQGGAAAFAVRAVLAATGAPTWGIYSGYELVENVPRPGAEEQVDNEKYEYKPRDHSQDEVRGIAPLLRSLNAARRAHPALRRLRNVAVHGTSSDTLLAFSRHLPAEQSPTGEADTVIVVANLDPYTTRDGIVALDLSALGLDIDEAAGETFTVRDELDGAVYTWGAHPYVRLSPSERMAHVLAVVR